jgi:hypothetical protein
MTNTPKLFEIVGALKLDLEHSPAAARLLLFFFLAT